LQLKFESTEENESFSPSNTTKFAAYKKRYRPVLGAEAV